jgi:uncharacterized membrane protein YhaH (DUF805 family)
MIIFRVCSNNGESYDGICLDKTGEEDMDLIKQCLTTKYATFSGRASRKEYWGFALFYISFFVVIGIIAGIIAAAMGGGEWVIWISSILSLLLVIPSLAVYIRRLHDTDHSAWWLFIAFVPIIGVIVLLYFLVIKGTEGTNRFGPDPLEK